LVEQLLDPNWYRAASLRPRLRPHVEIHRQHFRGQRWYVVQDNSTGRYHRFSPMAYRLIGLMDGKRTLGAIWHQAAELLGDDAPTQGETLRLMHQLHAADVLQTDAPADADERLRRFDKDRQRRVWQYLKSPLAIRLPLIDPERFLERSIFLVRPLFSWAGGLLWIAIVSTALLLAAMHWPELTADVSGRLLAPQNLLLIWLVFPVVKALHELGHAYLVKHWGGEVHQIGIMFLVFMPVPYVDASASTAFRNKYQRALVGAAGMLVEVLLAAVAMFVWVLVEPGLVKAVAYNVMIIAGVSTILFNANPLLRFDAYYILSDLIEIPNLGQRSNRYVFYLVQRYLFGVRQAESPVVATGERGWFLFYAPVSFAYRMVIFAAIILFVGGQFFFIGVVIAIWAAFNLFLWPALKGLKFLLTSPVLTADRWRAGLVSLLMLAIVGVLLFVVPVPLASVAEGVRWTPEGAQVRTGASGFVRELRVGPGDSVVQGQVVAVLSDPMLAPQLEVLVGERAVLEARYDLVRREERVRAAIVTEQLEALDARIQRALEQRRDLEVRAPVSGSLVMPKANELPGRYIAQGTLIAYVVEPVAPTVRAVVDQSQVDLVRNRTRKVTVRFAEAPEATWTARIVREVPTASLDLPSPALATTGGGRVAIDPRSADGLRALEKVFQFDLEVDGPPGSGAIGGRVHVRFDHGTEPIGLTWIRDLRRLLLRHFDV
jgi:putative peptide zinc metalloprotease protein